MGHCRGSTRLEALAIGEQAGPISVGRIDESRNLPSSEGIVTAPFGPVRRGLPCWPGGLISDRFSACTRHSCGRLDGLLVYRGKTWFSRTYGRLEQFTQWYGSD